MSGDYSRFDFDPTRDYNGVLLQQGRPLTDWDWNAQVSQANRRQQAGTFDTLGEGAVVPSTTPDGFLLSFDGSGNLQIGRGRVYVDGLLAENHGLPPLAWDTSLAEQYGTGPMPYLQQVPYFPNPPALPATTGPHLVYIDVWEREVTQYQATDVLEKALGVDTTTRLQTVWQVKVLENSGDVSVSCSTDLDDIPDWTKKTAPSGGLMTTRTATYGSDNPCLIPPTGGYTGLENQLYRVEIHDPGAPGTATFKWSRDNASVQTRVNRIDNGTTLYVDSLGRDATLGFKDGDWIEISDDWRELNGLPGQLRLIPSGGVNTATLSITLGAGVDPVMFPVDGLNNLDATRNTRITRWDQGGTVILTDTSANTTTNVDVDTGPGTIQVPGLGTITVTLENGIVVSFDLDSTGNPFRSGDYWQFAARAVDASIDLLVKSPPRGIHHHYAKLGFITMPNTVSDNCIVHWPPVSTGGGDGCACTVCVSPEQHSAGTPTIQMAINTVLATGGSVCLVAGEYELAEPLQITGAKTLHLLGQGNATQLLSATGKAIQISGGSDVALQDFSIQVTRPSAGTPVVQAADCQGLRIERLSIATSGDAATDGPHTSAVALGGQMADVRIRANVFATPNGIVSGDGFDPALQLGCSDLRIDDNVLLNSVSAISMGMTGSVTAEGPLEASMGGATCLRIRGNRISTCSQAGIFLGGDDSLSMSDIEIAANRVEVLGDGMRLALADMRIVDNDVVQTAPKDSKGAKANFGIAVTPVQGKIQDMKILAYAGDCHIVGNRISGFVAGAIAVEANLAKLQIEQNQIDHCGNGIEVEGCEALSIENNEISDINQPTSVESSKKQQQIIGIDVRGVRCASAGGNALLRVGTAKTSEGSFSAGIYMQSCDRIKIANNEIYEVGAANALYSAIAGVIVAGPFGDVNISANQILRDDGGKSKETSCFGIIVLNLTAKGKQPVDGGKSGKKSANAPGLAASLKTLLAAILPKTAAQKKAALAATAVVTSTQQRVVVVGNQTTTYGGAQAVLVIGVDDCDFSNNQTLREQAQGDDTASVILQAQTLIVGGNRVVGTVEKNAIDLLTSKGRFTVLGNATNGPIRVNNVLLAVPWAPFNIIAN